MGHTVVGKRARSAAAKEARRGAILNAAQALIEKTGFETLTMNAVAQRAGLSKGTLYLYVQTKEELFLLLFVNAMEDMTQRLEDEATRGNFAELIARVPLETPLFLPLLARQFAVIEANVEDDALLAAKRRMLECGKRTAALISRLSGAPFEQADQVASVLMMAMQGAAQTELSAKRGRANLPTDLAWASQGQSFEKGFPVAVRLIIGNLFA